MRTLIWKMADMAEGGELHAGQVDLRTNNMLGLFGGANPSVIPQPGDISHGDLFQTSKALVKILRHQTGAKRGNHIPCNGGGWVNIDRILDREDVRVPAASVQKGRQIPNHRRVHQVRRSESTEAETANPRCEIRPRDAAGWTKENIDWIRRERNGWWQPWCVRASSGHSDFGFARPAKLCNILFPNMSDRLGGAFHVTKASALEGIILRGIVPGGNDSARRLAVHFGVFAPWGRENISPSTCQQESCPGGTIVAFETIPFKEIRAIWSFESGKDLSKRSSGSTPASSRARSVQDSGMLRA